MNVVDSSCWLEFFSGSEVGEKIAPVLEDLEHLVVPSITIYEVFKKLLRELDEDRALFAVAHMKQGKVVDLDADLAISSARIGQELRLPLADSIIYSVSTKHGATLWTQDKHFQSHGAVKYFEKRQE
ncbi:MAG TPA: type II toxin-antitoxin system VapC family toxin [Spirochaetia bacterium]|nr:type II toxin-antitoxin system VapC family toxin [Spirochaetia bacterium]